MSCRLLTVVLSFATLGFMLGCTSPKTCATSADCSAGQACVRGQCESGETPDGGGAAAGAPCTNAPDCASLACSEGKCSEGAAPTSACANPGECSSGACEGGKCAAGSSGAGTSCTSGGSCASGVCSAGQCQKGAIAEGSSCTSGPQCASGVCARQCTSEFCYGTCQQAPAACRKVDVLIAVDRSGSMSEEMTAMRQTVFPAFAERLRSLAGGLDDFRVGTIDACPQPPSLHTRGTGGACNFEGGHPWIESTSSKLVDEFKCVGAIYAGDATCSGDNDDEQPASASAAALEPAALAGPNAGFKRDDAMLVVVAITDEDEQPVPGATMQEVHDRLAAVNGGFAKRMVFLGIGGNAACSGVYGDAEEATRLKELTGLFINEGRGVFWDLCAGKLEDGLGMAMKVVEDACLEFPRTGGAGAPCTSPGQCASNKCENLVCAGNDTGKPIGDPCADNAECASYLCIGGVCRPRVN